MHPDVCGSEDAERHFIEVVAAYEQLIGKSRTHGTDAPEHDTATWDWHDWCAILAGFYLYPVLPTCTSVCAYIDAWPQRP